MCPPEAGSGRGTSSYPSGLGTFLATADPPSSQLAPQLLTQNWGLRTATFTHPESWGQFGIFLVSPDQGLAGKVSGLLGALRACCLGWLPEASGLQNVGDSEAVPACRWPSAASAPCRVAWEGAPLDRI